MTLPPEIMFRSAQTTEPDDEIDCLSGFHMQYQIHLTMVNVVILAMNVKPADPLPVEEEWLQKLDIAAMVSDDDEDNLAGPSVAQIDRLDEVLDQVDKWVESVSAPTLCKILASLTTKTTDKASNITLHMLLNQATINLQLKTVDGEITVIRHEGVPPWPKSWNLGYPFGTPAELPAKADVPTHLPSEVVIIGGSGVRTARVADQVLRCKLNHDKFSTLRECEIYRKLFTLKISELRVPALKGYVEHEDEPGIVAILLEDIAVDEPATKYLCFGSCGIDIPDPETPGIPPVQQSEIPAIDRRRKWAHQIKEIVKVLHENDIVWGDVKPANIVIDVNDNAWVLDFGGGCTVPWKYPADKDTILGDLKALEKIEKYLETGELPARLDEVYGVDDTNDDMLAGAERSQRDFEQSLYETTDDSQISRGNRNYQPCSPIMGDSSNM